MAPAVRARAGTRGVRPCRCRRQVHCRGCRDSDERPAASTTRSRQTARRTDSRADTSRVRAPLPNAPCRTGAPVPNWAGDPLPNCAGAPLPNWAGAPGRGLRAAVPECATRCRSALRAASSGRSLVRPSGSALPPPARGTAEALRDRRAARVGGPRRCASQAAARDRGPPPAGERGVRTPAGVDPRHPAIRSDARTAGRERAARAGPRRLPSTATRCTGVGVPYRCRGTTVHPRQGSTWFPP